MPYLKLIIKKTQAMCLDYNHLQVLSGPGIPLINGLVVAFFLAKNKMRQAIKQQLYLNQQSPLHLPLKYILDDRKITHDILQLMLHYLNQKVVLNGISMRDYIVSLFEIFFPFVA